MSLRQRFYTISLFWLGLFALASPLNAWWQSVPQQSVGGAPSALVTWNSSDKTASVTLSAGDLVASCSPGDCGVRATAGISGSDKKYFELIITNTTLDRAETGVANSSYTLAGNTINNVNIFGIRSGLSGWDGNNAATPTYTTGDTVGVAIDFGNKTAWMRVCLVTCGDWNGDAAADPATNTNGLTISGLTGPVYPTWRDPDNFDVVTGVFTGFAFTPPSGFTAITP